MPDSTPYLLACAVCDEDPPTWPNTEDGRMRLREHGAAKHGGTIKYTLVPAAES